MDNISGYQTDVIAEGLVSAWLQSFDGSTEISVDETRQMEDITVLNVHTDQLMFLSQSRGLEECRQAFETFANQIYTRDGMDAEDGAFIFEEKDF